MPKALVVDDSRAIRMILSQTLREIGFEVEEAAHGLAALEQLEENGGSISLVLADWNMPEMNGLELLKAIRRKPDFNQVRVVMVTTETEISQMVEALEAGANEYVMKPFTKEILIGKLELAGVSF